MDYRYACLLTASPRSQNEKNPANEQGKYNVATRLQLQIRSREKQHEQFQIRKDSDAIIQRFQRWS